MDTSMVFVKTAKGHEEIEKRTYHLNFKHRTALILVDGVTTVDTLLGKIPGDGLTLLEELLRDGHIAPVGGKGTEPASIAEPLTDVAGDNAANFDLESAKRRAVKMVEAALGPNGESLSLAIERCKSRADFTQQAKRARDVISQVSGARKAAEFWAQTGL